MYDLPPYVKDILDNVVNRFFADSNVSNSLENGEVVPLTGKNLDVRIYNEPWLFYIRHKDVQIDNISVSYIIQPTIHLICTITFSYYMKKPMTIISTVVNKAVIDECVIDYKINKFGGDLKGIMEL